METHTLPALPFTDFPDSARVWIYQAGRSLTDVEKAILASALTPFTQKWKSHGADVRGGWALYADAFVLVAADEERAGVSGCSTDGLVRAMQEVSAKTGADFFNRMACGLIGPDGVFFAPLPDVKKGNLPFPPDELLYADLTPTRLAELRTGWPIPLTKSWIPLKSVGVL